MYLITAYFDDHTTQQIKRYINRIASASGNRFMTDNHVPAHLTLAAVHTKDAAVLLDALESMQGKIQENRTWDIEIMSIGLFLPHVIYAAPVFNQSLDQLSTLVFREIEQHQDLHPAKCYSYRQWMPHITLAKTLTSDEMLLGVEELQKNFVPIRGQITEIGLSGTNPYEDLVRFRI